MTAIILGGMRMRKMHAALTAVAIVLGVAMISGTYVLMDTTLHAFNSLFATAYSKADAVVVGKSPVSSVSANAPPVPSSVLVRIRSLPQVADAPGFIDDRAELRNAKGGSLSGPGTPLAFGAPGQGSSFNTLQVVAGHRPIGAGEIALDVQTAKTNHWGLGSTVGVVTRQSLTACSCRTPAPCSRPGR
jgi:putative ABC transport system permease protein